MLDICLYFGKSIGIKSLKQSRDCFFYVFKYSDLWHNYCKKDSTLDDMEADLLLLNC